MRCEREGAREKEGALGSGFRGGGGRDWECKVEAV